jgi:hypothetical protein
MVEDLKRYISILRYLVFVRMLSVSLHLQLYKMAALYKLRLLVLPYV